MKLFKKMKDGGPESKSTGYWLVEWKRLFSIVILRFDGKSRDAYHTHAFNAINWLLWGKLEEHFLDGTSRILKPSLLPIITPREPYHKVDSLTQTSWAISFRGPWLERWKEWLPDKGKFITLSPGRKVVNDKEDSIIPIGI